MESTLIVHSGNSPLDDLDLIYYDKDYDVLDDSFSSARLRRELREHKRIILIGPGDDDGLMAPMKRKKDLGRMRTLIGPEKVEFLRNKEIIGLFENSEKFAKRYKLTGLFLGDLIFTMSKAYMEFFHPTPKELKQHTYEWCLDLAGLIRNNHSYEIPKLMMNIGSKKPIMERLNYESLDFYIDGINIEYNLKSPKEIEWLK